MAEEPTFLNLHSLLTVDARKVDGQLRKKLEANFGSFLCESLPANDNPVDMVVDRLLPGLLQDDGAGRKRIDAVEIILHKQSPAIIFRQSDKPVVAVLLNSPLTILYDPRKTRRGLVIDCLHLGVQLVLGKKNGTLLKAAVVSDGNRCAVFSGLSGAGKTSWCLYFLQRGWQYLSDNTCILHRGMFHLYRKNIVVNSYHYEKFNDCFASCHTRRMVRFVPIRRLFRRFSLKYLPLAAAQSDKLKRIYDPYISMDPTKLFPGSRVVTGIQPTHWFVLVQGDKLKIDPVGKEEMVDKLHAIHSLSYPEFHRLGHELELLDFRLPFHLKAILSENIGPGAFYRMTLPPGIDLEQAARALDSIFPGLDKTSVPERSCNGSSQF